MSALQKLASSSEWVDVESPDADDDDLTVGYYDGEAIETSFKRMPRDGDPEDIDVYRNKRYTIKVEENGDGRHVRVKHDKIENVKFQTKPIKSERRYYELTLPTALVRALELDRVTSSFDKTVDRSDGPVEYTFRKGVFIEMPFEWNDGHLNVRIHETSEERQNHAHVRRVQRKPANGYEQYYIYFPRTLVAAHGLEDAQFVWSLDEDSGELRADVIGASGMDFWGEETDNRHFSDLFEPRTWEQRAEVYANKDTPTYDEYVPEAAAKALEDGKRGDFDEAMAEMTADDYETILRLVERPMEDADPEYFNPETQRGALSITLHRMHSAALGFATSTYSGEEAPKYEKILKNEQELAYLVETTDDGPVFVAHPAPEKLPENRLSDWNTVNVTVNNYDDSYPAEYNEDGTMTFETKRHRAGNQIRVTFPKEIAHTHQIINRSIMWRPVRDVFFDTDETVLVGRLAEDLGIYEPVGDEAEEDLS